MRHVVRDAIRSAVLAALAACGGETTDGTDAGASDAATTCTYTTADASVPCGTYTVTISGASACGIVNGAPTTDQCQMFCGSTHACTLASDTTLDCALLCGKARTSLRRRSRGTPLASHLRDSVWLEAASVDAFRVLAQELETHGAPRALSRAAREAARDEARHARAMTALAARHGVRARSSVRLPRHPPRALVDVAIENAVEGCVHETVGAALAELQAVRAHDPRDRAAMKRIARDEERHAVLASKIARWAASRLSPAENARVSRARAAAARKVLRNALPHVPALAILGLPSPREAAAMTRTLAAILWV